MKQEKVNKTEIITLYEQSNFVSVINNFESIKLNELAPVRAKFSVGNEGGYLGRTKKHV